MELLVMVGIPGSGKSALAKGYQDDGIARICPDDIRWVLTGNEYWPSAEPTIWAMAQTMARAFLRGGQSVLIDATNVNKYARADWVRIGRDFNVKPSFIVMDTPLEECLRRNRTRERYVPQDVIERMHSRFEMPTEKEGNLYVIKWEEENGDQASDPV